MHLTSVTIENIRCLRSLRWSVPEEKGAGWHVILGENGSGKTTFLRAAALALLGSPDEGRLRPIWSHWLRKKARLGKVEVCIQRHDSFDPIGIRGECVNPFGFKLEIKGLQGQESYVESLIQPRWDLFESKSGWFSAAYGPFRRFSGGDPEYEQQFLDFPRLMRHLSLFEERVAFTETITWIRELHHQKLEEAMELRTNGSFHQEDTLLDRLISFINQPGFLPHGTRLTDVSSRGVHFEDGTGAQVPISELSDGYRSILSLTIDLLRRLVESFGQDKAFTPDGSKIAPTGVVLIDEIDAHLHPTWQHEVGLWFKKHFPNIQFIVSTHSPIVCQAADTVFVLPRPGTREKGKRLTGIPLSRLRYGNLLDAYGTGVFGHGVTRSQKSRRKLERLAELNIKELEHGLSEDEQKEQERLRAMMPTAPQYTNGASHARDP